MILDEKGNQIIAKTNEHIISVCLKLASENKDRILGLVNKTEKTFQINRIREKHLLKRNKSYGFNYYVIKNAKTFDKIYLIDDVTSWMIPVSFILEKMETAKKGINILIVDACRDDPFGRSFRSNSRGLVAMDAPRGTIIAYATAPGRVAADGSGRNSPYTKNLVRAMQLPNTPIELMFKEVRRSVQLETQNQQIPWENTSLSGNFYFYVPK